MQCEPDSTILQELSIRDQMVASALDQVLRYEDFPPGKEHLLVLNILSEDTAYTFRISVSSSNGLGRYLYWRNIRPNGYFYFKGYLVLVFAKQLDGLLNRESHFRDFPFLSFERYRPKTPNPYIPSIYEPIVHVYRYVDSTLTLKSTDMLEVIELKR